MQQFAFHFIKGTKKEATYALTCRSNHDLLKIKKEIQEEINNFESLSFTPEEIEYLRTLGYFKEDYLDFLKTFNFKNCHCEISERNGKLSIRVSGPWEESILYEVSCLAIIQEIYFKKEYNLEIMQKTLSNGREKLHSKIKKIKDTDIKIIEFGTRRRFSFEWQKEVLGTLLKEVPNNIIGSSNVLLAKEFGIKPIGTMAHEFLSAMQGLDFIPIEMSQKYALHMWYKEYGDALSIALTDIFNIDSFLHDCDFELLSKYKGFRHDSGNPFTWGERLINHCMKYGVNPKSKTFVFSDGLDIDKSVELHKRFSNQVNVVFGIGTNLTNDFDTHESMSLVMKMVRFNGNPVIKVSDEPAKISCEDDSLKEKVLNFLSNLKKKEYPYPIISSCVDVVVEYNDKVLLIKRGDSSESEFGKIAFPGGFVDINEKVITAAKRELLEETGLDICESRFKFMSYKDATDRDPRRRTISFVFKVTISDDDMQKFSVNGHEVSSYLWVKKEESKPMDFAFDHADIFEEIKNEKLLKAKS